MSRFTESRPCRSHRLQRISIIATSRAATSPSTQIYTVGDQHVELRQIPIV